VTNNEGNGPNEDKMITGRAIPLWLSVEEAAPWIGETKDAIYRDIRENQFPFDFVRHGKRIKISAKSIGLIPTVA
jgi:hypothetical protein